MRNFCITAFIAILLLHTSLLALGQTTGDYRSKQNGNWGDATSWERYNGTIWVNAVTAPTSSDGLISILSGHNITIATAVTADQVVTNAGGL